MHACGEFLSRTDWQYLSNYPQKRLEFAMNITKLLIKLSMWRHRNEYWSMVCPVLWSLAILQSTHWVCWIGVLDKIDNILYYLVLHSSMSNHRKNLLSLFIHTEWTLKRCSQLQLECWCLLLSLHLQ